MKSTNKIKLRNLDPEVLAYLKTMLVSGKVNYGDLSPALQAIIRNGGGAGGGYDDTLVFQKLTALENGKVNTAVLADYFNKASDFVTEGMLDQSVLGKLNSAASQVTLAYLTKYRRNDVDIEIEDLSNALRNRLNAIESNAANLGVKQTATENKIAKLDTDVMNLKNASQALSGNNEALEAIRADITTLQSGSVVTSQSISLANNNINSIRGDIDTINQTLNDKLITPINPLHKEMLDTDLQDKLAEIDAIQNDITALQSGQSRISGRIGQIATISKATGDTIGADLVQYGRIARSAAEVSALQTAGEDIIFDAAGNVLYIKDGGATATEDMKKLLDQLPPAEMPVAGYWHIDLFLTAIHLFAGKLLCDPTTGEVVYNNYGVLTTIKSPVAPAINVNQNIAANGSFTYAVADPYSKRLKVLVLDNDSLSRTYNKYINSEAVATVAYNTNGITIYNDTESALTFKICQ